MKARRTLLGIAFLGAMAAGPDAFDPIPGDRRPYTIDFAKHFYANAQAEAEERLGIDRALQALAERRGHLADSAEGLASSLAQYESLLVRYQRDDAYLYLRYATDTTNAAARDAETALAARVEARRDEVLAELASVPPSLVARFVRERPALREYEPFFRMLREGQRPLPACSPSVLGAVQPLLDGWQSDLHDVLLSGVPPTRSDASSAAERREAFFKHDEALRQRRDAAAFALIHLASARNAMAKLRGYEDGADEAYARSGWSKRDVTLLLEELAAHADLYKRYQRFRAERLKTTAGLGDVHVWDLDVRLPGSPRPRFTIGQARTLLLDVLHPLGPVYGVEIARLLDPAERRLDVVPGPNRKRGGFSKGFPGMTSVFYAAGFGGEYNDVRVLMHESTHAVHRQLEGEHGVRPVYASGPGYVLEATAIFNELLLADTMSRRSEDPALRRFYLEQFLDGKGLAVIFVAAAEAALEQSVSEGVARDAIRGADDLDALTRRIFGRYSIWAEETPELSAHWMEIPLMYEDPFYDVNYVWAGLVALKLFAAYERDPGGFPRSYVGMMQNGFDRPAEELLRDFAGIDLHDSALVGDALSVSASRVATLERDDRSPPKAASPDRSRD